MYLAISDGHATDYLQIYEKNPFGTAYASKFRIVEVISYLCGCMTLKYTFEFYETNMGLPCGSCPDSLVKFLSCSQIG